MASEAGRPRPDTSRAPRTFAAGWQAPLNVWIADGKLTIEIGIGTMAYSATYADWANPWNEAHADYIRTFAIEDPDQFAEDVGRAMKDEREDGSSPLTDFIDKMMQEAIEQGSLGLHEDFNWVIKHGESASIETWAKEIK